MGRGFEQFVALCHPQQGNVWGLSPCCCHPRDKDARTGLCPTVSLGCTVWGF